MLVWRVTDAVLDQVTQRPAEFAQHSTRGEERNYRGRAPKHWQIKLYVDGSLNYVPETSGFESVKLAVEFLANFTGRDVALRSASRLTGRRLAL